MLSYPGFDLLDRRRFLGSMGGGLAGLALFDLLAAQGFAEQKAPIRPVIDRCNSCVSSWRWSGPLCSFHAPGPSRIGASCGLDPIESRPREEQIHSAGRGRSGGARALDASWDGVPCAVQFDDHRGAIAHGRCSMAGI